MDRRIEKTKKLIFEAFYKLIKEKDYSKISIQDIIDLANVGRSTFYYHFETKDDVLIEMCRDLFEHIFNPEQNEEAHCFIDSSTIDKKVLHILYHLLEKKDVIKGIFKSEGQEIFVRYFRKYLNEIANLMEEKVDGVPLEILKSHLSGSFIELIRYWINNDCKEPPEEMARYYSLLILKK